MKNIALIKSIVATSISSANPAELTEHIAALIQAHPEETRENALAILTGTAELTVRPVDQVELTCNSSNYTNLSFMGEPTVNLLEGTVCCSINYTRTETRWYKTQTIKPWYRLFFTTCSSKQNLCRMFTIVALLDLVTLIRSRSSCRTSTRSRKKTVHSWMLLAICGQV